MKSSLNYRFYPSACLYKSTPASSRLNSCSIKWPVDPLRSNRAYMERPTYVLLALRMCLYRDLLDRRARRNNQVTTSSPHRATFRMLHLRATKMQWQMILHRWMGQGGIMHSRLASLRSEVVRKVGAMRGYFTKVGDDLWGRIVVEAMKMINSNSAGVHANHGVKHNWRY